MAFKQNTEASRRCYRLSHQSKAGWVSFQVKYRETDLWIRARQDLSKEATSTVLTCRHQLEHYIAQHPEFLQAMEPLPGDRAAPELVRHMLEASGKTGVGPMASVAGAIAESVARRLKQFTSEVVVENGGDCYLDLQEDATVGVYIEPDSPFHDKVALQFTADRFPLSICTSSGTIGHSISFGSADAVSVVAGNGALADAAATALGNLVRGPADLPRALERATHIPSLEGVLIIVKDKMAIWGKLELTSLPRR